MFTFLEVIACCFLFIFMSSVMKIDYSPSTQDMIFIVLCIIGDRLLDIKHK